MVFEWLIGKKKEEKKQDQQPVQIQQPVQQKSYGVQLSKEDQEKIKNEKLLNNIYKQIEGHEKNILLQEKKLKELQEKAKEIMQLGDQKSKIQQKNLENYAGQIKQVREKINNTQNQIILLQQQETTLEDARQLSEQNKIMKETAEALKISESSRQELSENLDEFRDQQNQLKNTQMEINGMVENNIDQCAVDEELEELQAQIDKESQKKLEAGLNNIPTIQIEKPNQQTIQQKKTKEQELLDSMFD